MILENLLSRNKLQELELVAARLSVVMIHTPPPTSRGARVAETLVGELIGRPGIDLVLVGPIADLTADSTDRLTLESITGDLAVLAWQPIAMTVEQLEQIGIDAQRWPHSGDTHAQASAATRRRLFGFDLGEFTDAIPIIDTLQSLLRSRGVKTFSIGSLGAKVQRSVPTAPSQKILPPIRQANGNLDLDELLDQLDQSDF